MATRSTPARDDLSTRQRRQRRWALIVVGALLATFVIPVVALLVG